MSNTLVDMMRMKDIRKKVLITLGLLAVSRIGAVIPVFLFLVLILSQFLITLKPVQTASLSI